jgi:hypothetical protein
MIRSSLLLVVLMSRVASAAPELTMQDLQALDKQGSWSELLDKADLVKPTARTADWRSLVEGAATHVLEQIDKTSHSDWRALATLASLVPAAELKYAFLTTSKPYLAGKARTLSPIIAACARDGGGGCGMLVASLTDGIDQPPKGMARDIALLLPDDPSGSVRFWALASDGDKASCEHPQLQHAVIDTLRRSTADRQIADARRAAGTCYAALEAALLADLVASKPRPQFIKNACPVLKSHGTQTTAKKKLCP